MGLNRAERRFYLTQFRLGPPLLHRVTDLQEVSAAEQTISRRPRIRFPAGTEERRIPISQIVDARPYHDSTPSIRGLEIVIDDRRDVVTVRLTFLRSGALHIRAYPLQ